MSETAPPLKDPRAEAEVIGDVLLRPAQAIGYLDAGLADSHFGTSAARATFAAIAELVRQGIDPDFPAVVGHLRDAGRLEEVSEIWLTGTVDGVPKASPANVVARADRLKRLARRRQADYDLRRFADRLRDDWDAADEGLIAELTEICEGLGGIEEGGQLVDMREAVGRFRASMRPGAFALALGIPTLDRAMRGLQRGELLCVLARTASGKTMLSCNQLLRWADKSVVFASLEMPVEQLIRRLLRMSSHRNDGQLDYALEHGHLQLDEFVARFPRLTFLDDGAMSLARIESRAVQHRRKYGEVDAVIVDHSGLLTGQKGSAYERATESAIGLKQLARRLKCVVVALVQADRGAANSSEPVPLESARDSGAYEENSDFVLALSTIQRADHGGYPFVKGRLAKNRRGPDLPFALSFDPASLRMTEIEPEAEDAA